jgi:hypothetical protein
MSEKVQLKGCICEPSSDIPLNERDIRNKFGYTPLSHKKKNRGMQDEESLY